MIKTTAYAAATLERFWAKVDKNGPAPEYRPDLGPCWLWTAATNKRTNYSVFVVAEPGDKKRRTDYGHRVSYRIHKGEIPERYDIDHLCRVRHCVNPDHLEAVTRRTNILRGTAIERRREWAQSLTSCVHGHKLTPDNVYIKPATGFRSCRTCRREQQRRGHAPGRSTE